MINGPLRPRILNDLDGSQLLSQVPLISTPFDLPQLNVRTMTLDEPTETLERFRWIRIVGGEEGLNGIGTASSTIPSASIPTETATPQGILYGGSRFGALEESQLDVAIDDDIAWPIAHAKALVVDASFPVFHLTDTGSPLLDTAARLNAIISGARQ